MKKTNSEILVPGIKAASGFSRRRFLTYAGMASAGLIIASCDQRGEMPTPNPNPNPDPEDDTIDLGSGDIGILNYAYALEQLEAAFYTRVLMNEYSGMTANERSLLSDIRDHEIAHREFFKNAIGDKAIPGLEVDFSSIDFTSRDSVMQTAKTFEDLGVSAYNGAGKLIVTPDYLVLAGKIVSVEARHAALIRDLIANGTFADTTDNFGMDTALMPSQVLAAADPFIKSKISGNNLPTE